MIKRVVAGGKDGDGDDGREQSVNASLCGGCRAVLALRPPLAEPRLSLLDSHHRSN